MRTRAPWLALAFWLSGCPNGGDAPPEWSEAFDASGVGWLLNVGGPAADDLYAVGGEPDVGRMMHFDGDSWDPVELGVDVPLLNWVHAFASDSIWVVGNGGTILHWDGEGWTVQVPEVPTDQDLWGVWGASPEDLWAVGGKGLEEGQATILRYDGTRWTSVPVPALERSRVWAFFKVWGTSADDVWIVGQRGVVLQWNGAELVEHLVGTGLDLISLWGTGPDRLVAVGGRGNGVVTTWDGTGWHTQDLSPLPGLNGVWMRHPDVVHAVGILGTLVTIDFETLSYEQVYTDASDDFHAVYGDDGGTLTAVGGNLAQPAGPYRGIAYRRPLLEDE